MCYVPLFRPDRRRVPLPEVHRWVIDWLRNAWSSGNTIPNCLGEFREIRERKERTRGRRSSGDAESGDTIPNCLGELGEIRE